MLSLRNTPGLLLIFVSICLIIIVMLGRAVAQGTSADSGHAEFNGNAIFAAWNFQAGRQIPKRLQDHPEFLPNLDGWDFRINLPFTTFRTLSNGPGSTPAFAPVLENAANDPILQEYGHINNSLWVFQILQSDKQLRYKVLPSRRDFSNNSVSNTSSLTAGWRTISGQNLRREKPATAVVGEGLGATEIFVAVRDEQDRILFTRKDFDDAVNINWTRPLVDTLQKGASAPSLSEAANGKLAMAWLTDVGRKVGVKIYDPVADRWTVTNVTSERARGRPQLIWDGTAVNLFYVRESNGVLQHRIVETAPIPRMQAPQTVMPLVSVRQDQFDVTVFNQRLHVVAVHDDTNPASRVFYTVSTSEFGLPANYAAFSDTGLLTFHRPEIAFVNDNLFAIAIGPGGRVRSARKDPNHPGNELTGAALADNWLESALPIANQTSFRGIDAVSFNSDIYLAGIHAPSDDAGQTDETRIINFSRAAAKRYLASERGIRFLWGEAQGGPAPIPGGFAQFEAGESHHPFLPKSGDVPLLGDFSGDGKDDLIKFAQKEINSNDGPAPVYVAVAQSASTFEAPSLWHRFFSLKGETPLVGDFNGDGRDDIVSFVQSRQFRADGSLIGPAPVWVALSNGSGFDTSNVWHKFFSLKGEVPMVGDFNGDGMDDIATFVQSAQENADGTPIGPAPVWVALSNGTGFDTSKVWHTFFSLKSELPMVGDFNGDGRDDIVSFVRKRQLNADGSVLGNAPVWVSLSQGTSFGGSRVWHSFFALGEEVPRVGDMNADGLDDIVTFLNDEPQNPDHKRRVLTAFSNGLVFQRSTTWHSNFSSQNHLPLIGSTSGQSPSAFTGDSNDGEKLIPSVVAFRASGQVDIARPLGNTPMPSGAPWENYKWFTEKALGTMMFPSWIWEGSQPCLSPDHRFVLLGASGSGGGSVTNHSVRLGGREGHVMQEVGHSIFANCFRENADPFDQWNAIFEDDILNGQPGFGANDMVLCQVANDTSAIELLMFLDCRDPEHYFLGFLVRYRLEPERYREMIATQGQPLLMQYYDWLKVNWYDGTEFATGTEGRANYSEVGVKKLD